MMRAARFLLAVAVMCLALPAAYSAQQASDKRAEVALQAAIKIETIDGDLKAAIEQYAKARAGNRNRAVAAQGAGPDGPVLRQAGRGQRE